MTLLLLTGAAGMFVGAQGVPPLGLFVVDDARARARLRRRVARSTTSSTATSTGSWAAARTSRPVASGRVPPAQALEFGLVLSALSFALLASAVNVLTAVLALVGNLFYVVVYTRWLKRSTPQNIVIGGAAGAVPPLVGYAAATGSLALPALWLFLIVFLWTPPHFWALALMIKNALRGGGRADAARSCAATARRRARSSSTRSRWSRSPLVVGLWLGPLYTVAAVAARRGVHRARRAACGATSSRARAQRPLPLLARLPRAALRRGGARPGGALVLSPELARKNLRLGWRSSASSGALRRRVRHRAALPPGRLAGRA